MATLITERTPFALSEDEVSWRFEILSGLGYSFELTERLATDSGLCVHFVSDLIARGCSLDLAAEIAATETILNAPNIPGVVEIANVAHALAR